MSNLQQDFYSSQLIESLSDVVDTLNEALADGYAFNFQIANQGNKFALVSLTATQPIALPAAPPAPAAE